MNYRIVMASSGYYYVQRRNGWGWTRTGGFFKFRSSARDYAVSLKYGPCCPCRTDVMEYV